MSEPRSAYGALVREEDSPHVAKAPSATFVAVLGVLAAVQCSYVGDISRRAGVDQPGASRVLARMRRLGLVTAREESAEEFSAHGGYRPRRYYTITAPGAELAKALEGAA